MKKVSFSRHPKSKVSHLWYAGASRAQPRVSFQNFQQAFLSFQNHWEPLPLGLFTCSLRNRSSPKVFSLLCLSCQLSMVGLCRFKLSYFEFPITSNAKPFPLDLPFSHFLLALSNSHYLEFSFVFLESS